MFRDMIQRLPMIKHMWVLMQIRRATTNSAAKTTIHQESSITQTTQLLLRMIRFKTLMIREIITRQTEVLETTKMKIDAHYRTSEKATKVASTKWNSKILNKLFEKKIYVKKKILKK